MRVPVAIVAVIMGAIFLAKSVQADACSDYHLALAARDAANQLVNKRAAAGFVGGKQEQEIIMRLFDEANDRLTEAQWVVRASLSNELAATAIDSLSALDTANIKAWNTLANWIETPGNTLKQPMIQLFNITVAINDAREWAFNEACR